MNNDQKGGSRICRLVVCQWDCSAGKEQNIRLRDGAGSIWLGQCPVCPADFNSDLPSG